jgi:hypothetical protein
MVLERYCAERKDVSTLVQFNHKSSVSNRNKNRELLLGGGIFNRDDEVDHIQKLVLIFD